MTESRTPTKWVAECFWPDVDEAAVRGVDARAAQRAAELTRSGSPVSYLGSLLMREDEVVLCLFDGEHSSVVEVAERAQIPFARILEASGSPWPLSDPT